MRISLEDEQVKGIEELTKKKLSKNGNELVAEVIEMAEENKNPDSPCWVESSCSEEKEDSE